MNHFSAAASAPLVRLTSAENTPAQLDHGPDHGARYALHNKSHKHEAQKPEKDENAQCSKDPSMQALEE